MAEINLDNLEIRIRKSTPKYHRRAKIWVWKESARMEITDQEKWMNMTELSGVINHEFLHWIISIISKTEARQYDKFLEACGEYYLEFLVANKQ